MGKTARVVKGTAAGILVGAVGAVAAFSCSQSLFVDPLPSVAPRTGLPSAPPTATPAVAPSEELPPLGGRALRDVAGATVIMGDSYSAGEGAGDYAEEQETTCHRSPHTYGALLGGKDTINLACSGAWTSHVMNTAITEQEPIQIVALSALSTPPGRIFLTVGGNDANFVRTVGGCLLADCVVDTRITLNNEQRVMELRSALQATYVEIMERANTPEWVAARGGQLAPLIVSPYPRLFDESTQGSCLVGRFGFAEDELELMRYLIMLMNDEIENIVNELAHAGYPIYYAAPVGNVGLPDHTMCDEDSYFHRFSVEGVLQRSGEDASLFQEFAHPTRRGYAEWARVLEAWILQEKRPVPSAMP